MTKAFRRGSLHALLLTASFGLAACSTGGFSAQGDSPFAPGVDKRADAVDGIEVGHRLIAAGQYELAIKSFNRAALEQGVDSEILSGLGTANLGLGRLGQAETLLRRAVKRSDALPEAWNNLGVVLMERGKTTEAEQIFRKAYALDNGESDAIRDNLRLALAKSENSGISELDDNNYKLVRRGGGDYLIRSSL
ncbi:tetratricopeptide repeat protein [Sulfitobacter mediterraneus]|uniref:tetratricopeptide repeat protein n=1 Tax=Sulfitobacter mediterraneus TaxID=83219 RepID=UPI001934A98B|nr:tetratricopeptide repeat protein [Sulfitobacter mediterraneus]MBM1631257.1 tetratricopeptide repeat protein [Sulfitobacter mediterraneus]MBM1639070.1 tetratricopeptide repeat protein [Sulfitobacter mediterraneus]MBM1643119.1 tetratricopeptide repeat protein [Sulfitobacter mediterraneus]MBM1647167.1 tetratricopeptide repeat protein [Sulfitobacter mediterraneus]MBM1651210.1 tetratricopeptide repeat protein [Sulfitobacter mediterraneus]